MDNTQINWLDYIIKLNDREINRRRASGFTLWALLGVVALLFVQLFDNVPLIFSSPSNLYFFLTFSALIGNLSVALLILIAPFGFFLNFISQERRMTSAVDKRTSRLALLYVVFLLLFISGLNFYSAFTAYDRFLYPWPFYVFGFFCAVQAVGDWVKTALRTRTFHSKGMPIPEISSGPFTSEKLRKIILPIIIILGCLLFVTLIFCIKDLSLRNYILPNFAIMKVSMKLLIFLIVIYLVLLQYAKKLKYDWLENLERRIVIEELSAQQIKTLFVQEFIGEKTIDWINSIQQELDSKTEQFLKAVTEAEQELSAIGAINKEFTFEIEGRRKAICNRLNEAYESYFKYSLSKLEQIDVLFKQSPFNSDEAVALRLIMSEWKNQTKSLKTRHDNFCASCNGLSCDKKEETPKQNE